LQPIVPQNSNLILGTLVHRGLADWGTRPKIPADVHFMRHAQGFLDGLTGIHPDHVLMPFYESVDLGRHMVMNYASFYGCAVPEDYEVLAYEQEVIVPVPGMRVSLSGTFDALLRHKRNGMLYVLERKTYGQRPREHTLQYTEQFMKYAWIVMQLFPDERFGGILYDGLFKRAVAPKGKTAEDLFLRTVLRYGPSTIRNYTATIQAELRDMYHPVIYPHHDWTGCSGCEFLALCDNSVTFGAESDIVSEIRASKYEPRVKFNGLEVVS